MAGEQLAAMKARLSVGKGAGKVAPIVSKSKPGKISRAKPGLKFGR